MDVKQMFCTNGISLKNSLHSHSKDTMNANVTSSIVPIGKGKAGKYILSIMYYFFHILYIH